MVIITDLYWYQHREYRREESCAITLESYVWGLF